MRERGLTVIELLIVVGMLAVVLGIAGTNLLGLRRQLTLEDVVNTFAQDLQTCRTNALSWGDNCRIRITGSQAYVVERRVDDGSYSVVLSRGLPSGVSFANVASGAWVEFDPRTLLSTSPGFPRTGGGVATPEVQISNGLKTFRLILSMTGAVKTASL